MSNSKLPTGWVETELKNCFLYAKSGGTPSTKNKNYYGGVIPFVKIDDISNGSKYLYDTNVKINSSGIRSSSSWIVPKNSLVYSMYASYGIPIINKKRVATSQAMINMIFTKDFHIDYIYYYLLDFKSKLSSYTKGTTQANLNAGIVNLLPIKVPPLNEQKRIVTKIEKLFSNLDNSDKYLAYLEKQLKRYRQSVLKSAFEGELTREWRIKHKINFEWTNKEVRDIIQLVDGDRGKNYPKKSDYLDAGYCLYLSTKNVRPFGFLFDDEVYISKEKHEQLRSGTLSKGDIVLTTRGTIGNVAFYDETIPYKVVRINSGMLILRIKEDVKLNPTYLMKYIQSPDFEKQRKEKVTGTAQPQLPGGTLKDFIVSVPNTLEEQNEIVNEIDKHFSIIDKLESVVQKSIQESKRLRQSILKQAFEGKLVEQDPNDESAEMLLEKIAKAKEEYTKEMSKRKKKQ